MGSTDLQAPFAPAPEFLDLRQRAADPAAELRASLAAAKPFIAPKYFYDALGSRLFEAICELPEYPLLRAERAILDSHLQEIAAIVGTGRPLVDLGAGNCEKAERLFGELAPSQYIAVDIAADFLAERLTALSERHHDLPMLGIVQDFSTALQLPPPAEEPPRTLFYPGSSIGNFAPDAALAFLRRAHDACGDSGHLLLGADLVRAKRALDLAYDDPLGVTASFNLNVLRNVNTLIGADFDVADWRHVAFFDPVTSRIEMHVEARCDVTVQWDGGERRFRATDRIHTENSYKYTPASLRALLQRAGFGEVRLITDSARSFAVAVASA